MYVCLRPFHQSRASKGFPEYEYRPLEYENQPLEYEYEYSENRIQERDFRKKSLKNMCSMPLQSNYRVYMGALLH
jgi:hypothetical protein